MWINEWRVWGRVSLNVIEGNGILLERVDMDAKNPFGSPSNLWNDAGDILGTDDSAIMEADDVLIATHTTAKEDAGAPSHIHVASSTYWHIPNYFLTKLAYALMEISAV